MKAMRGFTLIELLIVMTLLSLLMTGLVSALRTMAQTETKIDQRFGHLDDLRTAHAFLAQTLGRLSVAKLDVPGAAGKTMIAFAATADNLTWVGILPARPTVGGRHYFRLSVHDVDGKPALVLQLAPCDADRTPPDWTTAELHLLMPGVARLGVQAQGRPSQGHEKEKIWPSGWQTGWPVADVAPEQLRLSLLDANQHVIQEWTFPLYALPQTDDTISTATFGGGKS